MMNLHRLIPAFVAGALMLSAGTVRAEKKKELRYVDAASLTVIGKTMETPHPFQRVDTARYGLWGSARRYAAYSTGLAVVFRTDSRTLRARWITAGASLGHNMVPIARKGLDLYIERDGEWIYAGFGWPNMKGENHESALVENMAEGEKVCLLYLPLWDGVCSLELGVDEDATIEAMPNPFRHKVVVFGSSITHGASAGRSGMTYMARMQRNTGIDFLNLGFSGQSKLQPEFARMLAEMEADAFLFDAFSNPSGAEIRERLVPFVATLRRAHPTVPLIFVQTEVLEKTNFDERLRAFEADKRAAGEEGVKALMEKDRHIYFIDSKGMIGTNHLGTVDGDHPSDEGFMHMVEHLQPKVGKILRRYGIR